MINYDYVIGLDLGQQNDYTVLSILSIVKDKTKKVKEYHLVYLKRYPLRTSYTDICKQVTNLLTSNPIKGKNILVADYTGVGRPVVDLLRESGIFLVAVNITSGMSVSWKNKQEVAAPKKDIVSSLQVAFQTSKLKVSSEIDHLEDFKRELVNFKVKQKEKGLASFAASSGYNDDIVMSLGIAVWFCENKIRRGKTVRIITGG